MSPATPLPQDPRASLWTYSFCPGTNAAPVGLTKAMLLGLGCCKLGCGGFSPPLLCKMRPSFQGPFQLLLSGSLSGWLILWVLLYTVFRGDLLPMQCWGWDGDRHIFGAALQRWSWHHRVIRLGRAAFHLHLRPTTVAGIAAPFYC